jgi:hypothetical protein
VLTSYRAECLEDTLRDALVRGRSRWADPAYLARIIFSEMIKDEVLETTGYGLAPYVMDDQYPTIEVDLRHRMVGDQSFEEFVTALITSTNHKPYHALRKLLFSFPSWLAARWRDRA